VVTPEGIAAAEAIVKKNSRVRVNEIATHLEVLTTFLLKEFYITCLNSVMMLRKQEICQNLKMAGIGRNM